MSKYLLGCAVGILGVLLFSVSGLAQSPIRTESLPPTAETPEERPADEGTVRATLDAQVSPARSPRTPMGSIELEATKAPTTLTQSAETNGVTWLVGAVILLGLSLLGNAFQLYRHRLHDKTTGNALMSTFSSIGLSLARCKGKTNELDGRLKAQKIPDPVLLKEFREFTVNIEFILRTLNEQLVSVARNLGQDTKTLEGEPFGDTKSEVGKITSGGSHGTVERSETA
ncbi:MAG: hypothetical protein GTO40_20450 [Deltaproteobacteria bacterium]|nr:hypothetical protein [Deltaproteobacteria bacterium]